MTFIYISSKSTSRNIYPRFEQSCCVSTNSSAMQISELQTINIKQENINRYDQTVEREEGSSEHGCFEPGVGFINKPKQILKNKFLKK